MRVRDRESAFLQNGHLSMMATGPRVDSTSLPRSGSSGVSQPEAVKVRRLPAAWGVSPPAVGFGRVWSIARRADQGHFPAQAAAKARTLLLQFHLHLHLIQLVVVASMLHVEAGRSALNASPSAVPPLLPFIPFIGKARLCDGGRQGHSELHALLVLVPVLGLLWALAAAAARALRR